MCTNITLMITLEVGVGDEYRPLTDAQTEDVAQTAAVGIEKALETHARSGMYGILPFYARLKTLTVE